LDPLETNLPPLKESVMSLALSSIFYFPILFNG
jgi:hypothetical protein